VSIGTIRLRVSANNGASVCDTAGAKPPILTEVFGANADSLGGQAGWPRRRGQLVPLTHAHAASDARSLVRPPFVSAVASASADASQHADTRSVVAASRGAASLCVRLALGGRCAFGVRILALHSRLSPVTVARSLNSFAFRSTATAAIGKLESSNSPRINYSPITDQTSNWDSQSGAPDRACGFDSHLRHLQRRHPAQLHRLRSLMEFGINCLRG